MDKQTIKDFTDRLKGAFGKMYNSYKDSEVDAYEADYKYLGAKYDGKAEATREAIMLVDKLEKEFTEGKVEEHTNFKTTQH